MRRGIATIIGTAVGTVLLVGAKYGTHTESGTPVAVEAPTQPAGTPAAAATTPATAARATKPARPTSPPARAGSGLKDGTYKGTGGKEEYGTIFVTITIQNGRIVDASATCSGCVGRSVSISDRAYPSLRQQTLAKQSANIATVSGATETSDGYRESLRSALEAAKR